ncbi:uncharacterized protein [Garra rufa]|uniref:uncharacterized protein n=1 Tax=Garra rufa TaxID=137080 RepID=UPI003CCEB06C
MFNLSILSVNCLLCDRATNCASGARFRYRGYERYFYERTDKMFSTVLLSHIVLTMFCQALHVNVEDLKCFNDYETEMQCSLSTDHLKICSGYKLNITHDLNMLEMYTCIFERSPHSDKCECKIKMPGFFTRQMFNTTLLEGTNVLSKTLMVTQDFIRPKTPVLNVLKTENRNFNVNWNDQYDKNGLVQRQFLEKLRIDLTYGIKGGNENVRKMIYIYVYVCAWMFIQITRTVQNIAGSFEIVAKNLQPNTNYILTATMSTGYNNHTISSDQSTPVEFTTSSSPNEIAKMLIPPLCVGLIIIILIIFICILRMKTNWWDKISKPKIDASLEEENGHIFPPSLMKFSPIHVEIQTLDLQEEKTLISASSVDTNNEKSSHRVESAPVDDGQACSGSPEENIFTINITSRVERALDEAFKSHPITNKSLLPSNNQVTTSRSYERVNGIGSSQEPNCVNQDLASCSGPSVFTDNSFFLEKLIGDHNRQSSKREVSDSDASNSQFSSPTVDTLEDGYQSFNSVLNKGNDADVCVKLLNAGKKCITSTNPLSPSLILHDGSITPSDEGYQAFQSLTKSTSVNIEQVLNAPKALKFPHSTGQDPTSVQLSSCASSLHFSPVIQIDSSYQSV